MQILLLHLQACLIDRQFNNVLDKYLVIQFIACAAYSENQDPVELAKKCLTQVYKDEPNLWIPLDDCAQKNDALKEQLRQKTDAVGVTQVPEIVVNGEKKTSEMANTLLVNLCKSFEPIKPRACEYIDTATSQTLQVLVFLTSDQSSQTFVQSQIKPILTIEPRDQSLRLRDVVQWQFVPWGPSVHNITSDQVECVNGANECLANRVLACATKQRQNGRS